MGCQWVQAVVLAGGAGESFGVITSQERPKPLLPVGNRPLISYPLRMLESAGFQDVIVVTSGEEVHKSVCKFVESYTGKMHVQVVSTETTGSADALRAIAHKITYENFMVVSGDLICDVSISSLVVSHCSREAMLTSVLKPIKNLTDPETGKPAKAVDYFGLSADGKRLLLATSASDVGRQLKLRRSVLRLDNQVTIRTDLRDSHLYLFSRRALEILEHHPNMHSVKEHLVPYLILRQVAGNRPVAKKDPLTEDKPDEVGASPLVADEATPENVSNNPSQDKLARFTHIALPSLSGCFVHILPETTYCQRVNSLVFYGDANREVRLLPIQYFKTTQIPARR
ncbi:hypothetical protein CYMTET_24626 [Cymbomonas tetramitiformis]|uniref:Translation initiation factor eIF2B subunit gamma n=1 Tax=Cymbomonas tetramitiformis TaxID=36881 RepID=A0AAE0FW86_9CHLO|nr:hypothetical protein CYMTET_24626 [Cymbomonas tetramitiformis]